ncbi:MULTISPECIES: hypothetical protein [unclassified Ensifer]|uniref:hypothetical protein n=1 Tax=unclassified Ensifer TaxID=2633371 RepID=UPI000813A41E|nr:MULTISPECIES: hypothetical protein [unclassified Ensifer]OCP21990.1 hypothetical protein BC361_25830 [Ensifer sp. LC54]OCP23230.1 hypothetical protein BC363_24935 [Ensifer sp. LC384]
MTDRRITNNQPEKTEDRLKHLAGLIQKLTYSEMNELAKLIHQDVDNDAANLVPVGLLKVSERILAGGKSASNSFDAGV